jgi:cytochrome c biogenesis protein CcdA
VANITLGAALAKLGQKLLEHHEHLLERLSAYVLVGLGVLYLVSHLLHAGHHHEQDKSVTGKAAILALSFSLALSPCSASIMLLIVATAGSGWTTLLLIAAVLLVTTVGIMLLLVGLTSLGIERLQFTIFERYEKLILGLVLVGLGAMILLFHR